MNRADGHEKREAHKISEELIHHHFAAAHKELQKEARHRREFNKMTQMLKQDLKAHHQDELSVHHDKHGNVTHIDFDKHDIFDKAKAQKKETHHGACHDEHHKLSEHQEQHKHSEPHRQHEHQQHRGEHHKLPVHPEHPGHHAVRGHKANPAGEGARLKPAEPPTDKNPGVITPIAPKPPDVTVKPVPPTTGPALDTLDGNKFLDPQQKAAIIQQAKSLAG